MSNTKLAAIVYCQVKYFFLTLSTSFWKTRGMNLLFRKTWTFLSTEFSVFSIFFPWLQIRLMISKRSITLIFSSSFYSNHLPNFKMRQTWPNYSNCSSTLLRWQLCKRYRNQFKTPIHSKSFTSQMSFTESRNIFLKLE